jgi:hypothetical protein
MNADKSFVFNPRLSAFIGGNRFGRLFHHPQKEVSLADLIHSRARAATGKPTGYEKNIEHPRCQAPQKAAVPAASR